VSAATAYFGQEMEESSESFFYLVTVVSVQAVPSSITLLLLDWYHFGGSHNVRDSVMQSLLTRDGSSIKN
jgi:hypothetical protein